MQRIVFILLVGLSLSACTVGIVESGKLTPGAGTMQTEEILTPEATALPTTDPAPAETPSAPSENTEDR